jgi:hypothetical protein
MTARRIVATYVNPPIPIRGFDWCAHYDGEEEAGGYGYGKTENEAIQDFIGNCEDDQLIRVEGGQHEHSR